MSMQQTPLTYEEILELFRQTREQFQETDRKFQETDRKFKETDRQFKETDKKFQKSQEEMRAMRKSLDKSIAKLGSRIGEIIEHMVKGNIVEKFQALGFDVTGCSPRKTFKIKELGISGEIDLFIDDGPVAILVEVKTSLETADVREHVKRLEKYRRYVDARVANSDIRPFFGARRFIGAVAGAVVSKEAVQFALENGMYVITQSGRAVEILTPPEGFQPKEW